MAGDATPYGLQHLLGWAVWSADATRDALYAYVAEHLGDPGGVVVVDETGFPKKGAHSAGVAPQYCGPLGKVGNCQMGVFLAYMGPRGHTLLGPGAVPDRGLDQGSGPAAATCMLYWTHRSENLWGWVRGARRQQLGAAGTTSARHPGRCNDCRLRTGHRPAVMGIFRRAALNMVRTVQQNGSPNMSIGLLRDQIGRHPWILAAALP